MDDEENPDDETELQLGGQSSWWNVTLSAETRGKLHNIKQKGRPRKNTRRTLSLDWKFQPSETCVATRSPTFDYLGRKWCVRFQRSPYDRGILHPPAWSLFLDLMPPYGNVVRVQGTLNLKHDGTCGLLWKFDKEFQPAWSGQEVVTWCQKRLNMEEYVGQMQAAGRDICIQVILSSIGLGQVNSLQPMISAIETLPFTLKVGTTTFARRFGWDLRPYHNDLTNEQLEFWKSLSDSKSAAKKVKFGPCDLAKAIDQVHVSGICTWRVCMELKAFVVQSIHEAPNGIAVMPYRLIFVDFDLMDGSHDERDDENEPWHIELCSGEKYNIMVTLLDWIVRNPLVAAADGRPFVSEKEKTRRVRKEKEIETRTKCWNCESFNEKEEMSKCSKCRTAWYCSRTCQRQNWKVHKAECANLAVEHEDKKKKSRVREKVEEEKKASNIQDAYWDSWQPPVPANDPLKESKNETVSDVFFDMIKCMENL